MGSVPRFHVTDTRIYDPSLGRWLQRDMAYMDGMNLYEYAQSRPTFASDPTGTTVRWEILPLDLRELPSTQMGTTTEDWVDSLGNKYTLTQPKWGSSAWEIRISFLPGYEYDPKTKCLYYWWQEVTYILEVQSKINSDLISAPNAKGRVTTHEKDHFAADYSGPFNDGAKQALASREVREHANRRTAYVAHVDRPDEIDSFVNKALTQKCTDILYPALGDIRREIMKRAAERDAGPYYPVRLSLRGFPQDY